MKINDSHKHLLVVVVGQSGDGEPGGIARVTQILASKISKESIRFVNTMKRGKYSLSKFGLSLIQLIWIFTTGKIRRKKMLVHLNVSQRGSVLRKIMVARLTHLFGLTYCLQLHSGHFFSFFDSLPVFAKKFVRTLFNKSSKVLVFNSAFRNELEARELCYPKNVLVVENGVPEHGPHVSGHERMASNKKMKLLFVGGVSKAKGCEDLFWLMCQADVQELTELYVAGPLIDQDIATGLLSLKSVTYLGNLSRAKVSQAMESADLVILPSYAEGMPLVLLEAMAAKKPVLATRVGAVPEIIEKNKAGLLYAKGDRVELLDTLLRMFHDDSLRATLALNGFEAWKKKYSDDIMVRSLLRAWQMAL